VTGNEPTELLVLGIGAALGLLGFLGLRRAPVLVLAAWLAAVCLVPIWVVVPIGPLQIEPQSVAAIGCLAALVPFGTRVRDRLTVPDALMGGLVVVGLLGVVIGSWSLDATFRLLASWLVAYLLGRLLWGRVDLLVVYRGIAIAFTVVAVLALAEAVTKVDVFSHIPGSGSLRAAWAPIQIRGGVARVEGAFGHSIALGGCLATAVPITLAARLRPVVTVGMVALMAAATVLTFSRIGMVTLALGLLLTLVFLPSALGVRLRVALAVSTGLVALAVLPYATRVFGAAGDEATNSAAYRGNLLSLLVDARWLGLSASSYRAPDGRVWFGTFRSIDNALLLLALNTGLLSLACALLALVLAAVAVVTRRGTAPTIALVAQVPAFASVALITQYATWVWFVAGLAVAAQVARRPPVGDGGRRAVDPAHLPRSGDTVPAPLVPGTEFADATQVDVVRGAH